MEPPAHTRPGTPPFRYSVALTMDTVAGSVPSALVDGPAWERARSVAERLPASLAQAFYLECRLGPHEPQVDWIVRVDGPGQEIIGDRNPRLRLPEQLRTDAAWVALARLCTALPDDPLLQRLVAHLWLEFDLEQPGTEPRAASVPRPSLFVAFNRAAAAELSAPGWGQVLDRLLRALRPGPASSPARDAARTALSLRPPGAAIPYLGFMLARPVQTIRLYFAGIAEPALPAELRRTGWPGDPHELEDVLRAVGRVTCAAPAIAMAYLDIDDEVLPRIGVEYKLRRSGQRRGTVAETPFLDRLVDLGLCADRKRCELDAWPGDSMQVLSHELWASRVSRRVNHVKLLHEPGRTPEAKSYLLTNWRPVSGAPPRRTRDAAYRR